MIIQQIHGFIHMPELEVFTSCEKDRFQPPVPNTQFGVGFTQAVCGHSQKRSFIGHPQVLLPDDGIENLFQTNAFPESFHGHDTCSATKSLGKNCSRYGGERSQPPFGDSRINLLPMEKGIRRLESRLGIF